MQFDGVVLERHVRGDVPRLGHGLRQLLRKLAQGSKRLRGLRNCVRSGGGMFDGHLRKVVRGGYAGV